MSALLLRPLIGPLIGPLLVLVGLCAVYALGYASGQSAARAAADRATVAAQASQLDEYRAAAREHAALIEASQAASARVRSAAEAIAQTNRRTTDELHQALAATAADRAGCRMDAGIVQQLEGARRRAAAAASGHAPSGADERLRAAPRDTGER
ncbi:MAG: hypothetical protein Q4A97_11325 [Comamonadaceae bacterium]|nr:hypothetical protein [Comamonadaceae bacterium]